MAQYFFDPAGVDLFSAKFTEVPLNSGKGWPTVQTYSGKTTLKFGTNFNSSLYYFNDIPVQNNEDSVTESLMLVFVADDDATNNAGPALCVSGSAFDGDGYFTDRTYPQTARVVRARDNTQGVMAAGNFVPVTSNAWVFIRLRVTYGPAPDYLPTVQARYWDEGSPEPTSWTIEVTDTLANKLFSTGRPGMFIRDSQNTYIAFLSAGTDGDPAPTSATAPSDVLPAATVEQGSELESSLAIAGAIPLQLSATLEQGTDFYFLSNKFHVFGSGFWNPATEPDSGLKWPYSLPVASNEIVQLDNKLVGTDVLPGSPSVALVQLDELGTGPFVAYGVAAKVNTTATTEPLGLRMGLTDSVSGAYVYLKVWAGNWQIEAFDGTSGQFANGTWDEVRANFELSYNTTLQTFILYINDVGSDSSINMPGVAFDSAFYQIGDKTQGYFEEHLVGVIPNNSTGLLRYILPSSGTAEQGSQVLAGLQLGVGRRLQGSLEQGSELVAQSRVGVALEATAEQGSVVEGALGTTEFLQLAGTVEQSSEVLGSATLGLRLSAQVEQDSTLVASAWVATPLAAVVEQGSELVASVSTSNALGLQAVLGQDSELLAAAAVQTPFQAFVEQDSLLLATAAYGIAKQATVEQGSELASVLRTDAGMTASVEQGSELTSRIVLAQRAAASVEQSSSLSVTVRVGVGLDSSVYGDSSVSGALTLGLPLTATIDQAATLNGALDVVAGARLTATIGQPSEVVASLVGASIQPFSALVEQPSSVQSQIRTTLPLQATLAQAATVETTWKERIPLASSESSTGSSLSGLMLSQTRLLSYLDQDAEFTATLNTDKRFSTLIDQAAVLTPAFRYAGQLETLSENDSEVVVSLGLSVRLGTGLLSQAALLEGNFVSNIKLPPAAVETGSLFRSTLRVPALGSTGWLTVSDIFFHNDYYSEVVFEKLPASEIAFLPGLRVDSVSIQPE